MNKNKRAGEALKPENRWLLSSEYYRKAAEVAWMIRYVGEDLFDSYYREAIKQDPALDRYDKVFLSEAIVETIQLGLELEHIDFSWPVYTREKMDEEERGLLRIKAFHIKKEGVMGLSHRLRLGII
jgi:hypothetical protein